MQKQFILSFILTTTCAASIIGMNEKHTIETNDKNKYSELNEQLYKPFLTTTKLEKLFQNGAYLDYTAVDLNAKTRIPRNGVLPYWYNIGNKIIVKKFLELGANPDQGNLLHTLMLNGDTKTMSVLLAYNPKNKNWNTLFDLPSCMEETGYCKKVLNILIKHSLLEDLNQGLIAAIEHKKYMPQVMQQLIDKGANPNIALAPLTNLFEQSLSDNSPLINKLSFLYQNKAFDMNALVKLKSMRELLGMMINSIESNQHEAK
jgi:hypothetical protein